MDDIEEARELIRAIRWAKHVDAPAGEDDNARDLENALKMLSEELYSKPTHFILELIQNADDNRYESDVVPKLSLLYRQDGYLWIGCNEIGFTEANVRAICRIAASTKKVENARKGYIGEKGIGFKAVFKVADVVWIKSGALSFKFDKTKPLGMIAPEWTDSHSNTLMNERTMFCFKIPDQEHRRIVQARLLELKPELLLFLRQLRDINIQVQDSCGGIQHSFSLSRTDTRISGVRHTTLQQVTQAPRYSHLSETFIVFQRTASNMPAEAKRQGISQTDVLVAFPIDGSQQPALRDRMTFNFLPIRSYGLSFVLQGDFMLSASREDILQDNRWNSAILSATLDLFVSSVATFNNKDLVKYTWPRFIESQGSAWGTIFQNFSQDLKSRLRQHSVLESQALTLEPPRFLQYVPAILTDGGNPPKPLMTASTGFRTYASTRYTRHDLASLGVPQQSADTFRDILVQHVAQEPDLFRANSAGYHSRLAEALLHIGTYRVRGIRLIPLRGGRWISSNEEPFYFAEIRDGLHVPDGIMVDMIDDGAAQEQWRRRLFTELGAKTLNATQVFELILNQHGSHSQSSRTWTVEDVVKHAWFLHNAPSRPSSYNLSALLVADKSGALRNSGDLYMDVPGEPSCMSDLFGNDSFTVRMIHDRYFEYAYSGTFAGWIRWLRHEVGVKTLPKLANPNGSISDEFRWLVGAKPSAVWLNHIKDHWIHYGGTLNHSWNASAKRFISSSLVRCVDGRLRKLSDTYLPAFDIAAEVLAAETLPMIAVDIPNDPSWLRFACLGLRTTPDLRFYLDILKGLPQLRPPTTLSNIKRMYSEIQERSSEDKPLVRSTFMNAALVYVATPRPGSWIDIAGCRWHSTTTSLSNLVILSGHYSGLRQLFIETLGVKNVDATDIVNEIVSLNGRVDEVAVIKELLIALSDCGFHNTSQRNSLARMGNQEIKVWPVRNESNAVGLRSASDISWFFPDRPRLRNVFAGKVPVLDFDAAGLSAVLPLLERMGKTDRLLSKHVIEETHAAGQLTFQPGFSDSLRSKARYVAPLLRPSDRPSVLERLSTIELWSATNLVLRRHIVTDGVMVFGNDEIGWVILQDIEERLRVYVSDTAIAEGSLPYKALCDRLMEACHIPAEKKVHLLMVLVTNNTAQIEDMLERDDLMPGTITTLQGGVPSLAVEDPHDEAGNFYSPRQFDEAEDFYSPPQHDEAEDFYSSRQRGCNAINATARSVELGAVPNGQPPPLSPLSSPGHRRSRNDGTRRSVGNGSQPSSSTIDVTRILSAAGAFDTNTIGVLGATTTLSGLGNSLQRITSSERAMALALNSTVAHSTGSPRRSGNGNLHVGDSFSMATMRSALDATMPTTNGSHMNDMMDVGISANSTGAVGAPNGQTGQWQQEIGYGGELFIYQLLSQDFHASDSCWTSNMRSRFGLSAFHGFEGACSDFTVGEPEVCQRITSWLVNAGFANASRWSGGDVTYHFEVKTTVGRREEPFCMSNNQVALARQWHDSGTDAYIILRVYDLVSSPGVQAYVDPFALMLAGQLSFTAQGGYYVQPV